MGIHLQTCDMVNITLNKKQSTCKQFTLHRHNTYTYIHTHTSDLMNITLNTQSTQKHMTKDTMKMKMDTGPHLNRTKNINKKHTVYKIEKQYITWN